MADASQSLTADPDREAPEAPRSIGREAPEAPRFIDRESPEEKDALITLEIHERQQLEVQLAHALSPSLKEPASRGDDPQATSLELYFFIPRNVGVSAANYPRDEFYGDLTTFLRVDLPNLTLEELAAGSQSPLVKFQGHMEAIRRGQALRQPLSVEVKLFGHTFTESVRRRSRALLHDLRRLSRHAPAPAGRPDRRWHYLDEVDRFGEVARDALSALRGAWRMFEPLGLAAPQVLQVFQYTDEYCSLFFDRALALIAQTAQELPALFDGSGFVHRLRHALARHARAEAAYRTSLGYLNLSETKGAAAEYFSFRQSFLKKAVQQALYVDTRRLATDTFVRNATGAVAAGLAATWALVAQLPTQLKDLPPTVQTLLLGVPVVAYIAKDRIKELTREWLSRRVRAFDTSSEIAVGSLMEAGLGSFFGEVQERASFLGDPEIPEDVLALRRAQHVIRGAELGGEGVLLYRRRLEIRPSPSAGGGGPAGAGLRGEALPPRLGLRQIVRLNMRHFLTRLDDAKQQEYHYAPSEDRFVHVGLPKVYHINLIARVVSRSTTLRRWRVVLNKKGLVRVESVA